MAYIFDIDWTLTQWDTFPPTWKESPNKTMIQTLDRIKAQWGKIYILTWRPNKYRTITEKWLRDNDIRYDKLIMNNTDKRSNDFKKEAVQKMYGINRWYDNNSGVQKIAEELNINFVKV